MKNKTLLTAAFIMFAVFFIHASDYWKPVVPGAPIGVGKRLGGIWVKAEPTKPETAKQARVRIQIEEMERAKAIRFNQEWIAWIIKLVAMAGFVVGAYIHLKSVGGLTKSIGSSVMTLAGGAYAIGAIIGWEADNSTLIECCVMAVVAGFIAWRLYVWRNEDGTKRKKKKVDYVAKWANDQAIKLKKVIDDDVLNKDFNSIDQATSDPVDLQAERIFINNMMKKDFNSIRTPSEYFEKQGDKVCIGRIPDDGVSIDVGQPCPKCSSTMVVRHKDSIGAVCDNCGEPCVYVMVDGEPKRMVPASSFTETTHEDTTA